MDCHSKTLKFKVKNSNEIRLYQLASWSSGNAFVSGAEVWGSNLGPVKLGTVLLNRVAKLLLLNYKIPDIWALLKIPPGRKI